MKKSRKKTVLICLECNKQILGGSHLSKHVQRDHGYSSYNDYKLKHNLIKSQSQLLCEGAIQCKMCGLISHDLTTHILRVHKTDIEYYKNNFGEFRSEKYKRESSERIKGEKNPGYNHGGKYSPLSDNFIHSEKVDKNKIIKKISVSNKNNGNTNTTLKYWLNKGYTEEEALLKISERQKTFSLTKCIEKYGVEEGTNRWKLRQSKWISSFKNSRLNGFSRISQDLFWKIFKKINKEDYEFIHFAQLGNDKKIDDSGKNNEYILNLSTSYVLPDFINLKTNKIIEFDGTYWHGKHLIKSTNKNRDKERDKLLLEQGFKVLHIKEEDYKKNPKKVIQNCLEFLYG